MFEIKRRHGKPTKGLEMHKIMLSKNYDRDIKEVETKFANINHSYLIYINKSTMSAKFSATFSGIFFATFIKAHRASG